MLWLSRLANSTAKAALALPVNANSHQHRLAADYTVFADLLVTRIHDHVRYGLLIFSIRTTRFRVSGQLKPVGYLSPSRAGEVAGRLMGDSPRLMSKWPIRQ